MRDLFDQATQASNRKTLRPHQVRAIEMLRQSFGLGRRRTVIQGPTGFGKTLTAAKVIEGALAKENRVIFTAPAVNLIDQTVSAFEAEGIRDIGVMQANHPRTDRMARVQVASVQTLARREIPQASMVIVDECHIHAAAVERLMDERQDVFFVGLSATPWAKGMGLRWQDLVIPCTIGSLIDGGFLSKFVAYAPDVPDLSGVKTVAGDYAEDGLSKVMGDAKLMASVVETWLAKGENRPTLCFCVDRAHADRIHGEFMRSGVSSAYVDGNTDSIERGIIGRQFRSGEVKVICSVRTMTTGVDLPVSCIIDAAPTKSEMLHVQKIGRGLRVNPGTEDLIILDHAGNSIRLGLVTDIHHDHLDKTAPGEKQERKPKAEKLPKECANCGTLQSSRVCPVCGHENKPSGKVETADGDLVAISGKHRAPTSAEKQAWFSGLQTIRQVRGRSTGWVANTYRDRFGVWPRGLDPAPGAATPEMWNFVKAKDIKFAKSREARA
ncbi:DEAD/DEAH box helicase [Paenirhodobacter populi]|nr:DEAD/DEAH box helicase [Sinirhodobacter populi]